MPHNILYVLCQNQQVSLHRGSGTYRLQRPRFLCIEAGYAGPQVHKSHK